MNMKRKLARGIAKRRMKKEGLQHICKHYGNGKQGNSIFAIHWKEWVKA